MSINNATVTEGNSGTVPAVFTVNLGSPSPNTVTVDFSTLDGTATAGEVLKLADKLICEGLSPDTLANSLSDHLRNLLVVRTCGVDSELIEVAGLSAADLEKQAGRFDPVVLTQDITILEDFRRQLRQTRKEPIFALEVVSSIYL